MDNDHREGGEPLRFAERTLGEYRARWLATVDEGYAEMQQRIDASSSCVRLETYILREEGPATQLREALLRARARGVEVHMLLDAFGCEGVSAEFLAPLRDAGVKIAIFNPRRFLRRTLRNHRKLLACDGTHAVIGGFNIAPEYAGDGVNVGWLDCGVYVSGPIVKALEKNFDALFDLAPFTPRAFRKYRRDMRHGWRLRVASEGPVEAVHSGPGLPRGVLGYMLRRDLAGAVNVAIASAYFLPSTLLRRRLYRAARGTGRVRVLLAGKTDVPISRLAAERLYTKLLGRRVRVFEYQPQIMHAKVVVMDSIVWAGSGNLDRRSLSINYELLLRFDWPELAEDARAWFAHALRHSRMVRLNRWRRGRSVWRRLASEVAWLLLARLDPLIARRGSRGLS
ncbi:MAG: phospholipase D-like domain-containing protein [Pseudomonadota bacterium]|nr:phospholipase D-like domain-containing protein [Pseudomonadota bacterium]